VYRVALVDPKPFVEHVPALTASLDDPDPAIRAYAALALRTITGSSGDPAAGEPRADDATFMFYDFESGELREMTVGGILEDGFASSK
jgi:hypothetical protein